MMSSTLRLPPLRGTLRLRLTLLYGGLFLTSGAALLAITYTLTASLSETFPIAAVKPGPGTLPPVGILVGRVPPAALWARAATLHQLLTQSGIALAIMTLASVGLGWLMAGRALRPLQAMTATTQRISADSLHERLAVPGPRELRELGDTIDGLLARLDGAFDAQRAFVANASHELRTPLTLARALIEAALSDPGATTGTFRSACQEVLAAGEQQEHLIDALLTLARSQRGLTHRDPVDLHDIATDVLRALEPEAATRGVKVNAEISPASLLGDARLIERLISNLTQNALRYNMPGGHVQVTTGTREGQASIRVINTGPAVPAGEIERLLQPFQRLSADRAGQHDGHGLGLSIVAAIARAHHARLSVRPAPGGGLDIRITFPPASPSPRSNGHRTRVPQRTLSDDEIGA
jgi:signal transduction histidine kinase